MTCCFKFSTSSSFRCIIFCFFPKDSLNPDNSRLAGNKINICSIVKALSWCYYGRVTFAHVNFNSSSRENILDRAYKMSSNFCIFKLKNGLFLNFFFEYSVFLLHFFSQLVILISHSL